MSTKNIPAEVTKASFNPHRIKAREALAMHGLHIEDCQDSIVPACCDQGCETEPDGTCEHGCPSVLIALGLI